MIDAGVGIVVVSHSVDLARAAIGLAGQMLHGDSVRIEEAAGLEGGAFGTDAVRVADAITRADGGRGVVVLMDLGSAVLSAELALDLLDPTVRDRVRLSAAPLVEGLCLAAVAATGGAGPGEVAAEAVRALVAKQAHLVPAATQDERADEDRAEGISGRFTVSWAHGLHARPAAALVQAVRGLDADVTVRNVTLDGEPVPAGSLSRVAALGAVQGHVVEVSAAGPDARPAVDRLLALAARGFGDLDEPPLPELSPADAGGGPLPAAPGIAIGPVWFPSAPPPGPPPEPSGEATEERARLRSALADVEKEVRRTRDQTAAVAGERRAAVFDAHLLLLDDPDLLERAQAGIDAGRPASGAWADAVAAVAAAFAALPDVYQRGRADDVRAVGAQVSAALRTGPQAGDESLAEQPPRGVVLVAPDLTPAEAATLDPERVGGVLLAFGSPTAHVAILVRALGIPAVVAAGRAVLDLPPGTKVALDGSRGEVVVDPSVADLAAFVERASAMANRRAAARAVAEAPAITRDGVEVQVGANLGSLDDAFAAAAAGADLAGLVRTELLFLGRDRPPDVDEQADAYRALAEALPGRRIVIRTLDVGGDKPLPYIPMAPETNPFLGVRGIRLTLARPELFRAQLRAVVRVARDHPVDVMFPMISTLTELLGARALLEEAAAAEGQDLPPALRVGIMVEVPATALKAQAFAPHVDFFSIGTNDLTQYALAAERGNPAVASVADPLDPGVLALIAATARADTTVGVCGELAADDLATGLLVGLGVRELSVVPSAVALVKQAVRQVDTDAAADLARAALAAPDAAAVRSLLTGGSA